VTEAPAAGVEAGPPAALRQKIKFCSDGDGKRIAYAAVGEGAPLVKAANWLSHLEYDRESAIWPKIWGHILTALADGRRLIRYDARGNGLSDWDAKDFSSTRS